MSYSESARSSETARSTRSTIFASIYFLILILLWFPIRFLFPHNGSSLSISLDLILKITIWILPIIFIITRFYKEDILSYLQINKNVGRGVILGIAGGLVLLIITFVIGTLLQSFRHPSEAICVTPLQWINTVVLTAIIEEIAFRGFLLESLRKFNFELRNSIVALLFVLIHLPQWISDGMVVSNMLPAGGYLFAVAWLAGLLKNDARSLWAAIILHGFSNFLACM